MAAFDGPLFRLVTKVGRDGVVGHDWRCAEGVGVYERWSGRWVVVCGSDGVRDGESVATQDVFEWCEFDSFGFGLTTANRPHIRPSPTFPLFRT